MSTTKAISGNTQKNDGGTILKAGNITRTDFNAISVQNVSEQTTEYGSKVFIPTGVDSSGNLGVRAANGTKQVGKQDSDNWLMMYGVAHNIAGVSSNILRSASSQYPGIQQRPVPRTHHIRLDESSWDYVTGAVTKGGSEGTSVNFHKPEGSGVLDKGAFPTNAIPGQLVYMVKGIIPTQDQYKAIT
jgi:hypothetical protein